MNKYQDLVEELEKVLLEFETYKARKKELFSYHKAQLSEDSENYLNGKVAEYFEVSAELSGKCDRYSEQTMKYVKAKDERMADNCRDKYDKVKALFNRNYDYYLAYKDSARAINRLLNKAKEENNNGKNV